MQLTPYIVLNQLFKCLKHIYIKTSVTTDLYLGCTSAYLKCDIFLTLLCYLHQECICMGKYSHEISICLNHIKFTKL